MPNRGEELARRSLIQNARAIKKVGASTLPAIATVASVEGDTVTVRVSGAEEASVEKIGFLSATVNVGDRGILLPIKDGGQVFARSGSALTSDDLPVTQTDPAAPTKTLTQKLAEIAAEEQRLENEKRNTLDPIPQNEVVDLPNDLANKRNTADPIPQNDVTNLVTKLNSLDTVDATKRNTADPIPQGDVTNLVTALNNKLEPGTPQSNIANLVSNLADKAPTTYVNSEIRLKTPSARVLGSDDVTTSATATGIGTNGVLLEYMLFSVGAYQDWRIDAYLECSNYASDGTFNGAQFGIAIPTGATLVGAVVGYRSSTLQWYPYRWMSSGLNPIWWMPSQSSGRIEIHATIKTAGTTGFLVVQKAVVNAGDQLTILTGSWGDAQRIINTD